MNRSLLVALLAGIAVASTPLLAQDAGDKPRTKRPASPVKIEMKKVDDAVDAVADFLKKPEGKAPMAQIAAAQAALQAAKQHAPRATQRQPEDKQAEFITAYKVEINKAIRVWLDLEDAMLAKDWQAAGKAAKELAKLKKSGHKKFKGRRRRRAGGTGGK